MRLQKSATTGHNCIKFFEKQELSTNAPTHDTPYLPQKCFISIVFSILRDDSNTHKKIETMVARNVFFCGRRRGVGGRRAFFLRHKGSSVCLSREVRMLGCKLGFHGQVVPHFPRDFACFSIPKKKKRDHS